MKNLAYVFNTWLLAHLFHPFVFALCLFIGYAESSFEMMPVILVFGMLFSLPALVLCLMPLSLIRYVPLKEKGRYLCWIGAALACYVLGDLIIAAGLNTGFMNFEALLVFSLPGAAALLISILVRYDQFSNLFRTDKNEVDALCNTAGQNQLQ